MEKIEALNALLPNFERFLEDLSAVRLTSDLAKQVDNYKNTIKNYIQQNSTQPFNLPPPIPDDDGYVVTERLYINSGLKLIERRPGESDQQYAARRRQVSRETYSSSGGSLANEEENIYEEEDKYLSPNLSPPPLPKTLRPTSLRPPSAASSDTDPHGSGSGSITTGDSQIYDDVMPPNDHEGVYDNMDLMTTSQNQLEKKKSITSKLSFRFSKRSVSERKNVITEVYSESETPSEVDVKHGTYGPVDITQEEVIYDEVDVVPKGSKPMTRKISLELPKVQIREEDYASMATDQKKGGMTEDYILMKMQEAIGWEDENNYDEPEFVRQVEDEFLYDDIEDGDEKDAFEDTGGWSSEEEFEEVGEQGNVRHEDYVTNIPASTPELPGKGLKEFMDRYKEDLEVDEMGELLFFNISGTISRRLGGKWERKYCVARDSKLQCFSHPKKTKAFITVPLPGHTVQYSPKENGKKHVIVIEHSSSKHMLSCRSKEEADKWIQVLHQYAIQLSSDTGPVKIVTESNDEGKKKKKKLFAKNKEKKKDREKVSTPQLTVDGNGVLSGYVNLLGSYYGEPKWKKRWISIEKESFRCHVGPQEVALFSFDLRNVGIDLADSNSKDCNVSSVLKIFEDERVYCHVEALYVLDTGSLLKSLVAGMTSDKSVDKKKQSGLVAQLLAAYQTAEKTGEPIDYENLPFTSKYGVAHSASHVSDRVPSSNGKVSVAEKFGYQPTTQEEKECKPKAKIVTGKRVGTSKARELDKLQQERGELEKKKNELSKQRMATRAQKFQVQTDQEKQDLDEELKRLQAEWLKVNKSLVDKDTEIRGLQRAAQNQDLSSEKADPDLPVSPTGAGNVRNMREKFNC